MDYLLPAFLVIFAISVILGIAYYITHKKNGKKILAVVGILGTVAGVVLLLPTPTNFCLEGKFTSDSRTICNEGSCFTELYSGNRFVQEGCWKYVENAKSLKSVWKVVYLEKQEGLDIELIDVNYTYIELALKFTADKSNITEMISKYPECASSKENDIKCDFKFSMKEDVWNETSDEFDKLETNFQYKYQEKDGVKETLKFTQNGNPLGKEYTFGGNSTVIKLGDTDGTLCPESGTITYGTQYSGSYGDTCASDDSYWRISWDNTAKKAGAIFNYTADIANPPFIKVKAEFKHNADSMNLRVYIYNFTGNSWLDLSGVDLEPLSDTVYNYEITEGMEDFIDGNLKIITKIESASAGVGGTRDYLYIDDPTIMLQTAGSANLDDTCIQEASADTNYGSANEWYIMAGSAGNAREEGIFKFNISSIPAGQQIDSATFYSYVTSEGIDSGEEYHADAHHVYSYPTYNLTVTSLVNVTYQETENETAVDDGWTNPTYAYDGIWSTYANPSTGTKYMYFNYTKIAGATTGLIQYKLGDAVQSNYTISTDCWNADENKIRIRLGSVWSTYASYIYCWDGTWVLIDSYTGASAGDRQYETGIFWGNSETNDVEWTEETLTWNLAPSTGQFNSTYEDRWTVVDGHGTSKWFNWTVGNMVQKSYSDGDNNVSIWIRSVYSSGSPGSTDDVDLDTKESSTASLRPYLNITYSAAAADTTAPTYSLNTSNATTVSTVILFQLQWDDETALQSAGQWIFSSNNTGTWSNSTAVNFSATPQNVTNTTTLNDTVGAVVQWKVYAKDNAGNWNTSATYSLTTTSAGSPEISYGLNSGITFSFECDVDNGTVNGTTLGQSSGTATIWAANTGGATGDFVVSLLDTQTAGWTMYLSNDNGVANAILLNTTNQTFQTGITASQNVTNAAWFWATCDAGTSSGPADLEFYAVT